jgi:hypothetical protein
MLPLQSPTAYCYCYATVFFGPINGCPLFIFFVCYFNPLISFAARHGHCSVVLSTGTVLVMGGRDDFSCRNDVWKTADSGADWSVVKANADWGGNKRSVSCSLSVIHFCRRQGCSSITLSLSLSLPLLFLSVFCRMRTYHQPINLFFFSCILPPSLLSYDVYTRNMRRSIGLQCVS